jgi:flagellar export protein FliJ
MKRFHFPLERVRRWRLEQLNLEQIKLQQVLAERRSLADAKRLVQDELAKSEQGVLTQPTLAGMELQQLDSFRIHVQGRIRNLETREREWETRVAEQRGRLLEARRRFELLDGLRDTTLAKWHKAADLEQETLAGELFLAKSTRNVSRS